MRISALLILIGVLTAPGMATAGEGTLTQVFYAPADPKEVKQLWDTYGSIPGGITLEGAAKGLPSVLHTSYDPAENMFILNGVTRYASPVSPNELREIAEALKKDDLLGVGFQRDENVYGSLPPRGEVAEILKNADVRLGRRIFGQAAGVRKEKGTSVHFRFNDYRFSEDGGYLRTKAADVRIMLVPVLNQTDENGNLLPDFETLKSGAGAPDYERRVQEMIRDFEDETNGADIKKILRYGEAAAFLRSLKSQNMDLARLLNKKSEIARRFAASA